MRKLITVALILQVCSFSAFARRLPDWPYEKLFAEADVVVIAEPLSTEDTKDVFEHEGNKPEDYTGMNTLFKVGLWLKGDPKASKITVLYFRYVDVPGPPGLPRVYNDGASFVHFRLKSRGFKGQILHQKNKEGTEDAAEAVNQVIPPPEYLLFIKRRSDGRFEPVSGQYDAAMSCREVTHAELSRAFNRYDD